MRRTCQYQGYEFGAGIYPDSTCIDGRLFDADNCDSDHNLYEPMDWIPCPICDRSAAEEYWRDQYLFQAITKWGHRRAGKRGKRMVRFIRKRRTTDGRFVRGFFERRGEA